MYLHREGLPLTLCGFQRTESLPIWEKVCILERNGIHMKKIRTDTPGYVIDEDEWQLVAETFRKGSIPRR